MRALLAACLIGAPVLAQEGTPSAPFPLATRDGTFLIGGAAADVPAPIPFTVRVPTDAEAIWAEPNEAGDLARLDVFGESGLTERFYAATIVLDPEGPDAAMRLYEGLAKSGFVLSIYALDPNVSWIAGDAPALAVPSVGAIGAYDDGNGNIVATRVVAFAQDGAVRGVMVAGAISTAAAGIRSESIAEDLVRTLTWRMIDSIQTREN